MQTSSNFEMNARYRSSFRMVVIGFVLGIVSFSILTNFGDFLPSYISEYYLWLFFPLFIVKVFISSLSETIFFVLTICYSVILTFLVWHGYRKYIYGRKKKLLKIICFSVSYVTLNFVIIFLTLSVAIRLSGTLSPKEPIRVPPSVARPSNQ